MLLCAVASASALLIVPPVIGAEHRSLWRQEPARVFAPGEAGCRSLFTQAMDGLCKKPATGEKRRAPGHRASSFAMIGRQFRDGVSWLLLVAGDKK